MIGIIVTGHGHFATGLKSSVELIAGEQKNFEAVDFLAAPEDKHADIYDKSLDLLSQSVAHNLGDYGTDKLERDIGKAINDLSEYCDGIIIFADLIGGSPFKIAVTSAGSRKWVKVLAGTNLPMLCEIALARTMIDDLDTLVSTAINVGKDGIQEFVMPKLNNEPAPGEEGI